MVVAHQLLRGDMRVPLASATLAFGLVEGEDCAGNIPETSAQLDESI